MTKWLRLREAEEHLSIGCSTVYKHVREWQFGAAKHDAVLSGNHIINSYKVRNEFESDEV